MLRGCLCTHASVTNFTFAVKFWYDKARMGRPTVRTTEVEDEICNRLSTGETLRTICSEDGKPAASTVVLWCNSDPAFAERYARARREGLDAIAEEIIDISDDGRNDWMEHNDPDNPGWRFNGEHSSRSKLRVDSRKWLLSKMRPDKYGDRNAVELTGANGGPVESRHEIVFVRPKEQE